jgi:proton-translocating NAD(P)+ transhydrogenase subunit alpha
MIIGITKETKTNEQRVAMVPKNAAALIAKGCQVLVETDAGVKAGYANEDYRTVGAEIVDCRQTLITRAEVITQVNVSRTQTADEASEFRANQWVIGLMDPLGEPEQAAFLAKQNITSLAMELIPRISRAQSMDALSSMATIAGYKAVLMAASICPRIYPMLMTAAGTLNPARVFIMGAGVAGLQAAATAKRLGGVVEAYDVRPAARDQIISVGAKAIELALDTGTAEGQGGYAKAQGEEFLARQRELMSEVLAEQDVVITTAAIPGAKSPVLITAEMVRRMKPGAVIIDLASERGGNCELTEHSHTIEAHGVTIVGPDNIAGSIPHHASQLYGKNIENLLLQLMTDSGELALDFEDEIVQGTLVSHQGTVYQPRLRSLLGLPVLINDQEQIAEVA